MKTSVLVIDDDATFRELAVTLLEGMGLSVVGEAGTVDAAAAAARDLRPQSALVDVRLPDGSGVTLARELTGLPWQPRVVLTSNDRGAVTEALVRASGAAAFVPKADLPDSRLAALLVGPARTE